MSEEATATASAAGNGGSAERTRHLLLAAIGFLYLLSVPWYRVADPDPPLLLGMPSWVSVALGCYAASACLNALAWLRTEVPDTPRRDAFGELGGPPE